MIDAPPAIQPTDTPQAVEPPQAASVPNPAAATRFDKLAQTGTMPASQTSSQAYRAKLRQFEAEWEHDPALHVSSHNPPAKAPPPASPPPNDPVAEADRVVLASLMQGTTLMQQTTALTPLVEPHVQRSRYAEIIAASEAAALEALRASPEDDRDSRQQPDDRQGGTGPMVGLAGRAAKKEWLRCVSGTPRPMRPAPHLPKI